MACFSITTKIFFGNNTTDELHNYLKRSGIYKLVFIVDKNISELNHFAGLVCTIEGKGYVVQDIMHYDSSLEPTYDMLDEFTENFRELEIDAIIAVGGGSVLDIGKGVGILLKNPGRGLDYRGMNKVQQVGVPVICYPTTGGTGSEVTHTASIVDTESKTKLGINGRYVAPLCSVLLPELTFSCPEKVTISAGLDAILHAIEAVSAKTANPITAMLGAKAYSMLYSNFRKVVAEPTDYDARREMLLGSYYAGIAMMNAGGGPASGISYPLGVHYDIPHGIAGGIFLRHIFEYNVSKGYRGYIEAYNNMPDACLNMNDDEKCLDFLKKFNELYKNIGAPEKLNEFSSKEIDVDFLTKLTMEQRVANLDLNPVQFGKTEVRELLNRVV